MDMRREGYVEGEKRGRAEGEKLGKAVKYTYRSY